MQTVFHDSRLSLSSDPANYLLRMGYMETLDKMAANHNVVRMAHSATDLGSFTGGYRELLKATPSPEPGIEDKTVS